jgi:hypothetical protein
VDEIDTNHRRRQLGQEHLARRVGAERANLLNVVWHSVTLGASEGHSSLLGLGRATNVPVTLGGRQDPLERFPHYRPTAVEETSRLTLVDAQDRRHVGEGHAVDVA